MGYVRVCAFFDENNVIFSVEDSGCGMDELTIKRLFKKTQHNVRFDNELNIECGYLFGLGLYICNMICEKMDTKLVVKSQKNKYSLFSFEL